MKVEAAQGFGLRPCLGSGALVGLGLTLGPSSGLDLGVSGDAVAALEAVHGAAWVVAGVRWQMLVWKRLQK